MKPRSKSYIVFSLLLILLLAFPANVRAEGVPPDSGEPGGEQTEEEVLQTGSQQHADDILSDVNDALLEDHSTVKEETTQNEVDPDEGESLVEIVSEMAAHGLVLVMEDGQEAPLGSEEVSETLTIADPYIERGGVVYRFYNTGGCAAYGGVSATCFESTTPIQAAINFAVPNEVIYIEAGLFNEAVTVNKSVTLQGVGSGSDPASNTVIRSSGYAVTITASGDSALQPLTLANLRIQGPGSAGVYINSSVSHLLLKDVTVSGFGYGLWVNSAANVTDLTIQGSSFNNNNYGAMFQGQVDTLLVEDSHFDHNVSAGDSVGFYSMASSTAAVSRFDNVIVRNSSFNNNLTKGIYLEKANNVLFENITVANSGTKESGMFSNVNTGIDINLKYGNYQNITILNSVVSDSGLMGSNSPGSVWPVGIAIKARSDGGYAAKPATLDNVRIEGTTISGGVNGIRIGEPDRNNSGPTNVVITHSTLAGFMAAQYAVINESMSTVDARNNIWGVETLAEIETMIYRHPGDILIDPWYTPPIPPIPPVDDGGDSGDEDAIGVGPGIPISPLIPVTGGRPMTVRVKDQVIIFQLFEEQADGSQKEVARVTLPARCAPYNAEASFKGEEVSLLADLLPEEMHILGPAFWLGLQAPDGTALSAFDATGQLRFTLPENFEAPAGNKLAVVHYDPQTETWVELTSEVRDGFAYAYSNLTGTFALVLVQAQ